MKAKELIHGGLYLIHDASDVIVRYDAVSHSFKSEWYEYTLSVFHDDLCATDGDRCIFVKPIPLTEEILEKNGFVENKGRWWLRSDLFTLNVFVEGGYSTSAFSEQVFINYVHELQRALILCGLNELTENFKVE